MKKFFMISFAALVSLFIITGCQQQEQTTAAAPPQATDKPGPAQVQPAAAGHSGKVIETMNSGGYTYVHVDTGKETLWAASNQFEVKVGDEVTVPPGVPMQNYHSKTLDRTFEVVYFVTSIALAGAEQPAGQVPSMGQTLAPPMTAAPKAPAPAPAEIDLSGIEKPEGGVTVAEVFGKKAELSGKQIVVRGKVVKVNLGILGKNWLHLRDGTGSDGTNDLTITTSAVAKAGDLVTASGVLALDKDFGAGYVYSVIIEDAEIAVE